VARYKNPPKPSIPDFKDFARKLVVEATATSKTMIKKFAERERIVFAIDIRYQNFVAFAQFPLSWRTIAKKQRYHAPLVTMVATGEYIKSIQVFDGIVPQKGHVAVRPWKTPKDVIYQLTIGISPNQFARDLASRRLRYDTLMQDVARIHEFGAPAANIPARPHWGPHFIGLSKRAVKLRSDIARLVCEAIRLKLTSGT